LGPASQFHFSTQDTILLESKMINLLVFLVGIFIAYPAAEGVGMIQLGEVVAGTFWAMCTLWLLYDLGNKLASKCGARLWLTIGTLMGYVFWLVMLDLIRMPLEGA
jgi:hypothetical protein